MFCAAMLSRARAAAHTSIPAVHHLGCRHESKPAYTHNTQFTHTHTLSLHWQCIFARLAPTPTLMHRHAQPPPSPPITYARTWRVGGGPLLSSLDGFCYQRLWLQQLQLEAVREVAGHA